MARMNAALGLVFILHTVLASEEWHYYGDLGPTHWVSLGYNKCGLTHQSPIDIPTAEVVYDADLQPITFTGYDLIPDTAEMKLVNNGHDVEVEVTGDDITISGGSLPYTYKLDQFHFHWGSEDNTGSEHTVDSMHAPMEMHIVHHSTAYEDITAADDGDDHSIAVLGFFFELQDDDNPAFTELVSHLSNVQFQGDETEIDPLTVGSLLPSNRDSYFRYYGSFTTPPCYESVVWTVFTETIKISDAQLNEFRSLYFTKPGDTEVPQVNNFRPTQDRHGRVVTSSNSTYQDGDSQTEESTETDDGASNIALSSFCILLSAVLLVLNRQ